LYALDAGDATPFATRVVALMSWIAAVVIH
jgi:hypothetical protein